MRYWITGFVLALAGCVAPHADTGIPVQGGLQALVGQPIQVAINELGYPDSEQVIVGDKVYRWQRTHSRRIDLPTMSSTGTDGTGSVTYGSESIQKHYSCTVTVATDASGKIKSAYSEGAGCSHYAIR